MRPVPGYENYLISEYGDLYNTRVKNKMINRVLDTPRLLHPCKDQDGYLGTTLCKADGNKRLRVHRLVLMAYDSPAPEGMHGAHIDGNILNNHISNLMWATPAENIAHNRINGVLLIGSKIGTSKLNEEQVRVIKNRCIGGETAKAISKDYGVSPTTIAYIRAGKTWKHVL